LIARPVQSDLALFCGNFALGAITMPVTIRREFVFARPMRGGEIIPRAGTVMAMTGQSPS